MSSLLLLVTTLCQVAETNGDYFPNAVRPAEQLFPAETIAIATVPDARDFRRRWNRSSFGAMADDRAFAAFFADVRDRIRSVSAATGVDVEMIWTQTDGELTLGLVPAESALPTLVAIANFDGDEPAAIELLDRLEVQAERAGSQPLMLEAGTRELTSWTHPNEPGRTLAYYRDGGQVVFGDGIAALLSLARRADLPDESTPAITTSAAYQKVKTQTPLRRGSAAIRWFINPQAAIDAAVQSGTGPGASIGFLRGLIGQSGLSNFRGFGGVFDIPGGEIDSLTQTYGYLDGPPTGLLAAAKMDPTPQSPPSWVKDSVSLYSQMNFRPGHVLSVMEESVDRMHGPGTFNTVIASRPVGNTGLTVAELADQLTGPLHFVAEIPESAKQLVRQPTIIAVEVRDTQVMEQIVRGLAAGQPSRTVESTAIHRIPLDLSDLPNAAGLPAGVQSPEMAVAVSQGTLMISTDAGYLERTIAGADAGRPLAESPEYQQIAANYPAATSVISYQRQDDRFAGLYEQLRSGGMPAIGTTSIVAGLLGFDFKKLPPFEAMSKYLQTTGGYIVPAEDGFRIVNFSMAPSER